MKCIKCQTININKANYCKKCCYAFSEKEQEAAKKGTFVGFLEKFDLVKSFFDFSIVTENKYVRAIILIGILAVGIFSWITKVIHLKIEESNNYQIKYNTKDEEYYLFSGEEQTTLNLYIPEGTKNFTIKHYNQTNELISEKDYQLQEEITLSTTSNDDYYILEANYSETNSDNIKLYIYYQEVGE